MPRDADPDPGIAVFRNPHRRPDLVPDASAPAVGFHRSLSGYRPTPLIPLPALASALGLGSLHVKDEGHRFGLQAFKVLGASWAAHRLLASGVRPTCLTTASAGNFGRAVAWTSGRLDLPAVIFLPADTVSHRVAAIEAEGATVELVDGSYDEAVERCARVAAAKGWQVLSDVGYPGYATIPSWIHEGYGTLLSEITDAWTGPGPDVVVAQGGVGGLASAVTRHFRGRARIVVVEPESADCLMASARSAVGEVTASRGDLSTRMAGLNCRFPCPVAWPVLREGVDLFVRISDRWTEEAMRRLYAPVGSDPGIVAGESGAAGLGALLALADPAFAEARTWLGLGPDARVLLLVTEGATDPDGYARVTGSESGSGSGSGSGLVC